LIDGILAQPDDLSGQDLRVACPTQNRDDIPTTTNGFTGRGIALTGCTGGPATVAIGVMTRPDSAAIVVIEAHVLDATDETDVGEVIDRIDVIGFP
jgi:hypothetical protein